MPEDRRLAAIMFTDIAGYTALMGADEDRAFDILKRNHAIHENLINKYNGTLIKEIGDGTLVSFPLASDAVRCAMEIQKEAKDQDIPLKIGIHQGEMVMAGADVLGDGVNIASRLQEASKEGCITISGKVYSDIRNKAGIKARYIGGKKLKNVDDPIKVYEVSCEEESEVSNKPAKKTNKLPYIITAGLIVVVAAILIWRFLPIRGSKLTDNASAVVDKSIAVLPFINDSPDQENEYFCNGMMEEILNQLEKISALKVKSRTAVEQYRNVTRDIKTIANELGVTFLVEGSVRKMGNDIRIHAQLIEGKSGDHLWSEVYDGKYNDQIFKFQGDLAKKIALSLQAVITPVEEKRIDRKPTSEIIAYDLHLQGIYMVMNYLATGDRTYLDSAFNIFDRAIAIDPNFGGLYFGKGHAYAMINQFDSALFYADKIIELNPEAPSGYHLKGEVYEQIGNKPDLAIEYFSKAIEYGSISPWDDFMIGMLYCRDKNDYVKGLPYISKALQGEFLDIYNIYRFIGLMFLNIGEFDRAFKYFKSSIDIRPTCAGNIPGFFWTSGNINGFYWTLVSQGKLDESLHFTDSICSVVDCEFVCARLKFHILFLLNEYNQAELAYNRLAKAGERLNILDSINFAFLNEKLGKEQKALKILENIRSSHEPKLGNLLWWYYYGLASANSVLGNKEEALANLSKSVKIGLQFGYHDYVEIDPTFENLRSDPEFKAIVKRAQDEKTAIRAQVQDMVDRGEIDL